jgi:tetratricopeptide (TPR) repeat protein
VLAPPRGASPARLLLVLLLLAGAGLFGWRRAQRRSAPAAEAAARASPATTVPADPGSAPPAPELPVAVAAPPVEPVPAGSPGVPEADVRIANELATRINQRRRLAEADVSAAEDLFGRHPEEERVKAIYEAVLLTAASQERSARRFPEASAHLRKAASIPGGSARPRAVLLGVLLEAADWTAAEAAARDILALEPRNAEALYGLGFALFRQDRNREAIEALQASLAISDGGAARALLARVQKGMGDETGMSEQRLSHFHVRYDGAAHEDVGREVLRVLERHYATLARTLDHQPAQTIPVILFSQQRYFDASGAPAWSGGNYDMLDGRIRIPIGGLTASLTPEMDETVMHELTHAFVADRTRLSAPREIHEGLAQYMEGKRIASLLSQAQLQALAEGRARGVSGFYLGALSFVEYLIAIRGMGGINELLAAMGETGNVDEAFRRVHGQDHASVQRAWREYLRRQYG